jgi:hypothetical protein
VTSIDVKDLLASAAMAVRIVSARRRCADWLGDC